MPSRTSASPNSNSSPGKLPGPSGAEPGGALGIAILGSIGNAAYQSYAGTHLPGHLAAAAGGSLPGAHSTAAALKGPLAHQVVAVGRAAFVDGLTTAAMVGPRSWSPLPSSRTSRAEDSVRRPAGRWPEGGH